MTTTKLAGVFEAWCIKVEVHKGKLGEVIERLLTENLFPAVSPRSLHRGDLRVLVVHLPKSGNVLPTFEQLIRPFGGRVIHCEDEWLIGPPASEPCRIGTNKGVCPDC